MSRESRVLAGILLLAIPSVMVGGAVLLAHLAGRSPGYADNPLRQDLWRAGHAHAGIFLVLSLVVLRYVDEAALSPGWRWVARLGAPVAAILIPAAFFLSIVPPYAEEAGVALGLVYPGAVALAASVLTLGIGLLRGRAST
jgi:hypothetical protein